MASITTQTNPDGKPKYVVNYRDDTGRQRRKTFAKKAQATAFANGVETDKLRGTYLDTRAGETTFEEYAERWLAQKIVGETTHKTMESRIRNNLYPTLGHLQLRQIKPSAIRAMRSSWTLAPSTQRVVFIHLLDILDTAVVDREISHNPARERGVDKPRLEKRHKTALTLDQVLDLYEQTPQRYQAVVTLGAELGLRRGEIFGLAREDIDLPNKRLHVRRQIQIRGSNQRVFCLPKGNKTRTVPLAPSTAKALAAYMLRFPPKEITLPWRESDNRGTSTKDVTVHLLITNREGNAVHLDRFDTDTWDKVLARTGLPQDRDHRLHALRHHYGTERGNQGVSATSLAEWMGHASAAFTLATYCHYDKGQEQLAADAAEAALQAARAARSSRQKTPAAAAKSE